MMISRQRQRDVLARFDTYKLRNRIDVPTGHDALRYCFRYIKRGISCALVVSDMNSVKTIMSICELYCKDLSIIKKSTDGFIFENNIQFRVLPKVNEHLAFIMLGKNVKVIQAREGDPKMKKFKQIMGL